jgi:uncharacterized protein (TIGR02118 family)
MQAGTLQSFHPLEDYMFTVVVLYGQPNDPAAFDSYYQQTHTPLAQKIPGLKRFEVTKVVGTPDSSPAPYYLVATLSFDSPEEAQAAMQSSEGQAAGQDLGNFATGGATFLLGPTQSIT